jgi:hypothetical protein
MLSRRQPDAIHISSHVRAALMLSSALSRPSRRSAPPGDSRHQDCWCEILRKSPSSSVASGIGREQVAESGRADGPSPLATHKLFACAWCNRPWIPDRLPCARIGTHRYRHGCGTRMQSCCGLSRVKEPDGTFSCRIDKDRRGSATCGGAALLGAAAGTAEGSARIVCIIGLFSVAPGLILLIRDFWKPPSS